MRKAWTTLLWLLAGITGLQAQISFGGTPPSFSSQGTKSVSGINYQVVEHSLDMEQLLIEEAEAERLGMPPRVAVQLPVHYTLQNSGRWDVLPDGRSIWRLGLKAPGALALLVSYHEFSLPEGVALFVYNKERSRVLGAYTNTSNPNGGRFSTEMLATDEICFEMVFPAQGNLSETIEKTRFSIDGLGYCFNKISVQYTPGFQDNGSKAVSSWCMININCPEGENWQTEKKSVCKMLMLVGSGWFMCTGTVVNNTAQDLTPYIATAYHCLSGGEIASIDFSQWQFIFDYESSYCEDADPLDTKTLTGASFRAVTPTIGGSDGMLLELTTDIPEEWGVYYSGWDRRNIVPADSIGVGIHHPQGDLKKFASLNHLQVGTWPPPREEGAPNAHFRAQFAPTQSGYGVTEGGSSGSGLFNMDHRFVGTLTGGSASCDKPDLFGYYGRLWYHWDQYGDNDSTQFKNWLDPLNTGEETIDGIFIDPTAPRLDLSREELPVFHQTDYMNPSQADTFHVKGSNLCSAISAWTTEPFEISTDGQNWDTRSELATSGILHVRYNPQGIRRDTSEIRLAATGTDTVRVKVMGNSCQILILAPETLENAYVDEFYQVQMQTSGSAAESYRYEIIEGRLPEGLKLSPEGLLSGIPSEFGLFEFKIRVAEPSLCDQVFDRSLYVVCNVIGEYPYQEGFESDLIPSCWTYEYGEGQTDWIYVEGVGNTEAPVNSAGEGQYNALFKAETYDGWSTKLITPQLDLSGLQNPCLVFKHAQPAWISDQDWLKVHVKNSATAEWQEMAFYQEDISQWQEDTIALPDPSDEYFVAFEGISHFGYGVAIDDIRIMEGKTTTITENPATRKPVYYNNPVRDYLHIEFSGHSFIHAACYDGSGRHVSGQDINPQASAIEIPMTELPQGFYWVVLESQTEKEVIKILKIK